MNDPEIRFALRIPKSTQKRIISLLEKDNCRSQNEFIEKAINFYSGYIGAKETAELLPEFITTAITGTIEVSEQKITSVLFKLAVELSMMMHVIADSYGANEDYLKKLRVESIDDVKKTVGRINFESVMKSHRPYRGN